VGNLIKVFVFVLSVCEVGLTVPALGQNIWAQQSGNWESTATWAGGTVPNSADNAYIGSSQAPGVNTATVTLQAAESASGVYVGYGNPSNGMLNLNGNTLTITNALTIGDLGGTGTVTENGGSFSAGGLDMYTGGSSFTFGNADAVTSIDIENGATLSTVASGNITSGGNIVSGGVVNLGANTSLSGGLNVEESGATLNLAGNNLSIGTLWLGFFQTSAVNLNRGSATAGTLTVSNLDLGNSQNLPLIAGDVITGFDIETGSTLKTATSTNITTGGSVVSGATLNLGANASLSGGINVEGSGSTLNLAGNNLTAGTLWLGFFQTSAVNFQRGSPTAGTLTVSNLDLGNGQNLALIAGDIIANVDIQAGASLTTAATSNITNGVLVNGATLNLGANFNNTTSTVNVENSGSTLNLAGHSLTTNTLDLGFNGSSAVTLTRGSPAGALSLNTLNLGNGQSVTLVSGDRITGGGVNGVGGTGDISIDTGATLTTVSSQNVTCTVNIVGSGSALNLGASLSIGNQVVNAENGAAVNMAGHSITASEVVLGYTGTSAATLNRGSPTQGALSIGSLYLGSDQTLALISNDRINAGDNGVNVTGGSTLTTVSSQNISNNVVNVETGGTMNLGASLSLAAGNLNIEDIGSIFNAQNHAVSGSELFFGWNGSAAVTVSNLGTVTGTQLLVGNGTSLTMHGGDTISSIINLEDSSVLNVQQSSGGTGLTLNGTSLADLTIDPSSMDLIFMSTAPGNWDFRWKDPTGANWISTLNGMINDQQINLTLPAGQTYQVVDSGGFTMIEDVSVPEPSSLLLMGVGLAGLGAARVRRGRAGVGGGS
jgi:PEP-CTERM motif